MSNSEVPFTKKETARDWAAIRGELSIYLLVAVAIGLAILCSELMRSASRSRRPRDFITF